MKPAQTPPGVGETSHPPTPQAIEWQKPGLTRLRYTYTALSEGLIPRFITRTYPLSEGEERWVNGVVRVMDDARALVRAIRPNAA